MKLESVFQRAQESVGVGKQAGIAASDISTGRELSQRRQRGAATQRAVDSTVHQLQQLHGEFDVTQPAGAELELAFGLGRRQRSFDTSAHRLHVFDELLAAGRVPDHRPDRVDVGRTKLRITGDRPGLQQRLEFPGLGPPLVVRDVTREGAHKRAHLALGPKCGIDFPDRSADANHRGRKLGGRTQRGNFVVRSAAGSATKMTSTSLM